MFQSSRRLQIRGLSFSKSMAHKVYEKINGSYNEELQAWLNYLLYYSFFHPPIYMISCGCFTYIIMFYKRIFLCE
ncbi:hypothetical protein BRARA_G01849 [Brassica rapa]|uniref:Uncharacterized protein n=1 Tax=Brassica campestris TaxID=3711 RepID=A0A397YM98_BRACM|nr:hypothetical protein BRARA_G01849 [Brassica rapa]